MMRKKSLCKTKSMFSRAAPIESFPRIGTEICFTSKSKARAPLGLCFTSMCGNGGDGLRRGYTSLFRRMGPTMPTNPSSATSVSDSVPGSGVAVAVCVIVIVPEPI